MKKSKWRKWKLGSASVIAAFFIFTYTKSTPEFAQAHQLAIGNTANNSGNDSSKYQDPNSNSGSYGNGNNDDEEGGYEKNEDNYGNEDDNGSGELSNGERLRHHNRSYSNDNNTSNDSTSSGYFSQANTTQRSHTRSGRS